ncbi:MAG: hypothetical protein KA746_09340 [Pyrinomonadaceae bacterium]|nr:hypothetical protein [Pyrinomonadaceae bacterium]MBP6214378.1 hypothetical protein [Pyrinomonadaceae bacterium]
MNHEEHIKIWPIRSKIDWGEEVGDLRSADVRRKSILLTTKPIGVREIGRFLELQNLCCFDIDEKTLNYIGGCSNLSHLYIDGSKTRSIEPLSGLRKLEYLGLERFSRIENLDFLKGHLRLKGLGITNFKNVHDISPLCRLSNLEQLAVAGGIWTRMTVSSLKPLGELEGLKYLHLTNLKVEDRSLAPLANLRHLRTLEIANFFPMEEFAKLSGILGNVECVWFSPSIRLPLGVCRKCKQETMVMLTGKGTRSLCQVCDYDRLQKHNDQFYKFASESF